LADWIEEEGIEGELDEMKCAMIYEALRETVGNERWSVG